MGNSQTLICLPHTFFYVRYLPGLARKIVLQCFGSQKGFGSLRRLCQRFEVFFNLLIHPKCKHCRHCHTSYTLYDNNGSPLG